MKRTNWLWAVGLVLFGCSNAAFEDSSSDQGAFPGDRESWEEGCLSNEGTATRAGEIPVGGGLTLLEVQDKPRFVGQPSLNLVDPNLVGGSAGPDLLSARTPAPSGTVPMAPSTSPSDYILVHESYGGGIWRMKHDGSELTELSDFGWFAQYSRGGEKIAFCEYYNGGIWVMDSDGSNRRRLTDKGCAPSWSPDGSQIVFDTGTTSATSHRIWVMDVDGSDLRMLTDRVAANPEWSNFGDEILFQSHGDGIWSIRSDGSGETRIRSRGIHPSWSPDDNKILFSDIRIQAMNPDGTGVSTLSTSKGYYPSMGADGRVAFQTTDDTIRIIGLGGTETKVASGLLAPDWSTGTASPPYPRLPVFSGVGLIPSTEITDGYATTDPAYYFPVQNAPFGGSMQIFGNFVQARANGAATYKVQVARWPDASTPPAASEFEDLSESWGNYVWSSIQAKYVFQAIGPDGHHRYPVPAASEDWYLEDLIMQWDSRRFSDGKYSLRMAQYRADGTEIALPAAANELVLLVDNTRPEASIDDVVFSGSSIPSCSILKLDASDDIEFVFTARDEPGHLLSYSLNALYGDNQWMGITGESYDPGVHGSGWAGVDGVSTLASGWPISCAYNFRLSVTSRVTDGYRHIHHTEYNKHITLLLD